MLIMLAMISCVVAQIYDELRDECKEKSSKSGRVTAPPMGSGCLSKVDSMFGKSVILRQVVGFLFLLHLTSMRVVMSGCYAKRAVCVP